MKKFSKSVKIWQSYGREFSGLLFFGPPCKWNGVKLIFHYIVVRPNTIRPRRTRIIITRKLFRLCFFPIPYIFFHFLFPFSPPPWSGSIKSSESIWFRSRQTRSMGSKYAKRSFGVKSYWELRRRVCCKCRPIFVKYEIEKRSLDF